MSVTQEHLAVIPKRLWPHLVVAALLSTLVHNLGAVYLSLPAPNDKVAWQWQSGGLIIACLIPAVVLCTISFNPFALALFGIVWLLSGTLTAVQNIRLALRNPASVRVRQHGQLALLSALFLFAVYTAVLGTTPLKDVTVFRAPQKTLVTEEGEMLVGFSYEPFATNVETINSRHNIHLQRGQLVLATLNGEPMLLRILAVSGDLFAKTADGFQVNGAPIKLARHAPGDSYTLEILVESIAFPRGRGDQGELGKLVSEQAGVVSFRDILVARDEDLVSGRDGEVPIYDLTDNDVIAVPSAKLWSIGDTPGERSSLIQPNLVFVD